MEVQIGCFTLPWSELGFEDALDGIAKAGYRYAAFGLTHQGIEVPAIEGGPVSAREAGKKVADRGLKTVMLFARWSGENGVDAMKRRIDQAKELGCPFLVCAGTWGYKDGLKTPRTPGEMAPEEAVFHERMAQIAPHALQASVTVTLKPHTGNTATAKVLRATLDRIGSPAVQACYDAGNVRFYEGISPEEDLPLIVDRTVALCIKDHRGPRAHADFPTPGDGEVDHPRLFRTLKTAGFQGPLVVERFDGTTPKKEMSLETINREARRAFEFLDRTINSVKREA
jgi:sugar phosphate isomerase/epimerase